MAVLSQRALIIAVVGSVTLIIWGSMLSSLEGGTQSFLKNPFGPSPNALVDSRGAQTTPPIPIQHIYYLKIHKTGSTTIFSILAEYCRTNELFPLLPVGYHINLRPPFYPHQVKINPKIKKYDMVFNHHVFDTNILKYLHDDTFKFTTIREPFKHFVSSFYYFRDKASFKYLMAINTSNPLQTLLENPRKYEAKGYSSYTNNRQSMDLGYNISRGFNDLSYIKTFINLTEKRFDLVLINDFFDESLILLKRTLGWRTMDILYYKKNVNHRKSQFSQQDLELQRQKHAQYAKPDIELYNHFLAVFKAKIKQEIGFAEEVQEFEAVLRKVYTFCDQISEKQSQVFIPAGNWTNNVLLFRSKCKWLKLKEISYTSYLRRLQTELLKF